MEVTTPYSHYYLSRACPVLSSHSPNGTCPTPGLDPLGGIPTEDLGRRRKGYSATAGQGHSNGLTQLAIDSLVTPATDTCMAMATFIIYSGSLSPLTARPLPCNRPTEIPLLSLHTTRMSPSPLPEEIFTEGPNGTHSITHVSKIPPRPLLGGGTTTHINGSCPPGQST